jgi:hypothetical protein
MTRPLKCPMTVPVAGRTACSALASVRSVAARRLCGHAPDIARFAFAPTGYPASGVLTLCRRKRLPHRRPLAAVSSSFSQTLDPAKRQNRSGKNHRRYAEQDDGTAHNPSAEYKGSHSPQRPAVLLPQTKLIKTIRIASRFPSSVQISQRPPQLLRQRHSIFRMRRPG